MQTNPYEYDTYNSPVAWIPQQNQLKSHESRYVREYTRQPQPSNIQSQRLHPVTAKEQKPKAPERMPKARALALVRKFKKVLVVASIVSFGSFSGLAAYHQAITTTSQASSSTHATGSSSNSTSNSSSSSSSSSSTSSSSGSYFNQQGNSNFGSSNSSSSSVSGTSVS